MPLVTRVISNKAALVLATMLLAACGSTGRTGADAGIPPAGDDGATDDGAAIGGDGGVTDDGATIDVDAAIGVSSLDADAIADAGVAAADAPIADDVPTADDASELATPDVAVALDLAAATPDSAAPDLALVVPPDVAPDLAPDVTPDLAPDVAPLPPDVAPPPDVIACSGACTCAAPTDTIYVDPVAGNDSPGSVTPTGAASPAACRFRTVGHALLALGAAKHVVVGTGAPPATWTESALAIPAGVSVASEDATAAHYTLSFGAGATAIALGDGASLTGFTVAVSGAGGAVSCPKGAATLHALALTGAGGTGLLIGDNSRCQVTLDDVGASGFDAGVLVTAGGLASTRLVATGNITYGLRATGDVTTVTLDGARIDGNGGDGVRFERGTLTATGLEASNNKGHGIDARGGSLTFHQAKIDANALLGIYVLGSAVTVDDGSQLDDNGESGVKIEAGTLVIGPAGAPVELSRNGVANTLYGVNIDAPGAGTSITISNAVMKSNYGYGIKVLLHGQGGTVTVSNTELAQNRVGGIFLRAIESTDGSVPFVVDHVDIHDNGMGAQSGYGILMSGQDGNISSVVKNCTIHDNGDTGIWVDQPSGHVTTASLIGNEIDGNNKTAGRAVGGVYFAAPSTLTTFTGNSIHDNVGDEVGFAVAPNGGGTWLLHGGLACDASANRIYCYGGGVGLRAASGVSVDAQGVAWQNAAPTAGVDFAGTVMVGGACPVVAATCR